MADERPRFDGEDALPVPVGAAGAGGGETGAGRSAAGGRVKAGRKCTPVKEWSKSGMLNTLRVLNLSNGLLLILADVLLFIVAAANVRRRGRGGGGGGGWGGGGVGPGETPPPPPPLRCPAR
jgi:hypothetical protein